MRTRWFLVLAPVLLSLGADWPQFLGPNRSGVSPETRLLSTWPAAGPQLVWTVDNAGTGYAGMAVVDGNVYTMGAREDTEYVLAYDRTGKELWATKIGPLFDFESNQWSRGPNATPTVDGNLLYGLGSQGILVCVDRSKGEIVWQKDMRSQLAGEVNPVGGGIKKMGWGYSWSPLVDGDQLICVPGGSQGMLAALNKKTGKVLWQSKDVIYQATYASPIVAEVAGVRQYIQMTQTGAVGVEAKTGKLLWEHKREVPYPDVVCVSPICSGDKVFITAWKGGCELLQLTPVDGKWTVNVVYQQREVSNAHGGVVKVGKYVYGYHLETGGWICQEFDTGMIAWKTGRNRRVLGMSSILAADGHLYAVTERGEVGLLEASPEKYVEKGRFKLPKESTKRKLRGGVWAFPSLSDGMLYVRDQELIFCYKVS
jgi:outer membrane protein assembly factor BamB